MRKICVWAIGLLTAWNMVLGNLAIASANKGFSNHNTIEVNSKMIDFVRAEKHGVKLLRNLFTELRESFSDSKNREIQVNRLNNILTKYKLFLMRHKANNVTCNNTIVSSKQPLTYMEDVDVRGRATRVLVTEYFGNLPPAMRRILQLMMRASGKVLCFGYAERKFPAYHATFYPSEGWVLVGNETNITGRFIGNLGGLKENDPTVYDRVWCVGIEGFKGKIVKIKPNEHGSYEVYFEGHAKRIDIRGYL